jgi:hypothetical protein
VVRIFFVLGKNKKTLTNTTYVDKFKTLKNNKKKRRYKYLA